MQESSNKGATAPTKHLDCRNQQFVITQNPSRIQLHFSHASNRHFSKELVDSIIDKQVLTVIATIDYVIDSIGSLNSQTSCHSAYQQWGIIKWAQY